jgi:ankyrin repeat protein
MPISMVKLLLSHHADPNKYDMNGYTPLHYAASRGAGGVASIELLAKNGAQIEAVSKGFFQFTPLFFACMKGEDDAVKELLKYGASPLHEVVGVSGGSQTVRLYFVFLSSSFFVVISILFL